MEHLEETTGLNWFGLANRLSTGGSLSIAEIRKFCLCLSNMPNAKPILNDEDVYMHIADKSLHQFNQEVSLFIYKAVLGVLQDDMPADVQSDPDGDGVGKPTS